MYARSSWNFVSLSLFHLSLSEILAHYVVVVLFVEVRIAFSFLGFVVLEVKNLRKGQSLLKEFLPL